MGLSVESVLLDVGKLCAWGAAPPHVYHACDTLHVCCLHELGACVSPADDVGAVEVVDEVGDVVCGDGGVEVAVGKLFNDFHVARLCSLVALDVGLQDFARKYYS